MTEPERVKIDGDRHYRVDGNNYVSVTTITGLLPEKQRKMAEWEERVDNPDLIRDRAALRGTVAHYRILDPLAIRRTELPNVDLSLLDDEMVTEIETCEKLWQECDFEVGDSPHIEQKTWHHEHEYAGTLDMLTEGTVVDLKTSKRVFPSHKLQVAAYWKASHHMSELPDAQDAAIINLNPDPESNPEMVPKVVRLDAGDLADYFDTFLQLREKYERGGV